MTHLLFIQTFTPVDAGHVLLFLLIAFLLAVSFKSKYFKKVLTVLFNSFLFLFWLFMPVIRLAFSIWNLFVSIVNKVGRYELRMRLTPDEEAELNENVFNQPLGI